MQHSGQAKSNSSTKNEGGRQKEIWIPFCDLKKIERGKEKSEGEVLCVHWRFALFFGWCTAQAARPIQPKCRQIFLSPLTLFALLSLPLLFPSLNDSALPRAGKSASPLSLQLSSLTSSLCVALASWAVTVEQARKKRICLFFFFFLSLPLSFLPLSLLKCYTSRELRYLRYHLIIFKLIVFNFKIELLSQSVLFKRSCYPSD